MQIIPKWKDKTARFKGTVAAGEHVAVSIANDDGYITDTTNLRLRVVNPANGKTLAQFPMPEVLPTVALDDETSETDEMWAGTTTLTCELNLNTDRMLMAVPPAANVPLLFVLDAYKGATDEDDGEFTLYFKDFCEVTHWPRRRGEDEPTKLDDYRDLIEDFREDIYGYGGFRDRVDNAERRAVDAAEYANAARIATEIAARRAEDAARRAENGNNALGSFAYDPEDHKYHRIEVRKGAAGDKVPVVLPDPEEYIPEREFIVTNGANEDIDGKKRFTDDLEASNGVKTSVGGVASGETFTADQSDFTPDIADIGRLDSCVLAFAVLTNGNNGERRSETFISTDGLVFKRLGRFDWTHENSYKRSCYHPIKHGGKWYIPWTSTGGDGWYETSDFRTYTEHLVDFPDMDIEKYPSSSDPFYKKENVSGRQEWIRKRVFFTLAFNENDEMYGFFCCGEARTNDGVYVVDNGSLVYDFHIYYSSYDQTTGMFDAPTAFKPLDDNGSPSELPSAIDQWFMPEYINGTNQPPRWTMCVQEREGLAPKIYRSSDLLSGYSLVKDFYSGENPKVEEIEGPNIVRIRDRYLMYSTEVGGGRLVVYSSYDGDDWYEQSAVYYDRFMPKGLHASHVRSFYAVAIDDADGMAAVKNLAGSLGGAGPFVPSALNGRMPPFGEMCRLRPGDGVKLMLVPGCTYCLAKTETVTIEDIDPSMMQVGDVCWLLVDVTSDDAKIVIPQSLYNTHHPIYEDGKTPGTGSEDYVYLRWNRLGNVADGAQDSGVENRDLVIGSVTETDRIMVPMRRIRRYDRIDVLYIDVPYVSHAQAWRTDPNDDFTPPNANGFVHTHRWSFRGSEVSTDNGFPAAAGGILEVVRSGLGLVLQRYTTASNAVYSRMFNGGTWSQWKEL